MERIVSSLAPALGAFGPPFKPASGHQDESQRYYNEIYHQQALQHHKASFTHEAIAGAVGFAAMHAYESHLRASGKEPSHALMKEILAGIAAAEVDKLIETKGLDMIDRHKAKKMAAERAEELAQHRYQGGVGWEYTRQQDGHAIEYNHAAGPPWGVQGHPAYGEVPGYLPAGYPAPPPGAYYPPPQQGYLPATAYGHTSDGMGEEHHRCHHGHLRRHCHRCRLE